MFGSERNTKLLRN